MDPNDRHIPPQQKPTLWEDILMLGSDLTGERSGPPPRLAVEGRSSGHGPMLPISDVDTINKLVTVECRRCFHTFAEGETHYDSSFNHSICNDQEACTLRMPTGGRKRARPEGGYARLASGR